MNVETEQMRVHTKFKKQIDDIKVKRIKNNMDEKLKSDRRITLAIVRHDLWEEIKKDIINDALEEKKK